MVKENAGNRENDCVVLLSGYIIQNLQIHEKINRWLG